jgi:hypothetical protein
MNLDLSVFDTAYDALADDVITKLKKTYPKHNIKRECKLVTLQVHVSVRYLPCHDNLCHPDFFLVCLLRHDPTKHKQINLRECCVRKGSLFTRLLYVHHYFSPYMLHVCVFLEVWAHCTMSVVRHLESTLVVAHV